MSPEQLKEILRDHMAWRRGEGDKRANLTCADLAGAYLTGANLARAYLADADLADGWEFFLWHTDQGWRIRAGCRFFTPEEARAHWNATRPLNTPLGAETHDILTMFEAHMARQVLA